MTDPAMRDNLLGYLLEALEPSERDHVEQSLERDPRLRYELEILDRALEPLRAEQGAYEPPAGLAQRTCEYVIAQGMAMLAPAGDAATSRWRMADYAVAAGVMIAASVLFFPAMNHSRHTARLASCSNNLRQIGAALTNYAGRHGGLFPKVPTEGSLSFAGMQAPLLVGQEYVDGPTFLCPASSLADDSQFRLPTTADLESASPEELTRLKPRASGSYGVPLGWYYDDEGLLRPNRNLNRANFALLADAPRVGCAKQVSQNHDSCVHNVYFEDGHVKLLRKCIPDGSKDNIFANEHNQVGPGANRNDAVVAPSHASPLAPIRLAR